MYDEPIRVMFNVYEPESPNEAGLCKYMVNRNLQMRGRV